jgi:hypothetical protein
MKVAAFLISTLSGFLIAHYLLAGTVAVYGSLLISYHLYLTFLILAGERGKGLSLPIGSSIFTHLVFLALLIGVGVGRHYIPLFGFIRYLTPSLAPFEAGWLFSRGRKRKHAAKPEPMFAGTADDYEEFLQYLGQRHRRFSRPGRSIREEQVFWFADRAKRQLR